MASTKVKLIWVEPSFSCYNLAIYCHQVFYFLLHKTALLTITRGDWTTYQSKVSCILNHFFVYCLGSTQIIVTQVLARLSLPPSPLAHQQEILHKLDEAKEARVTLNRMRREHQERVRQQEQEQAVLARMQMEQKLALLRQQKAEQFTYQQALQKQRLDDLQTQRSEYEQQLAQQREAERLELVAKEKQVLQHQFGQAGWVCAWILSLSLFGRFCFVAGFYFCEMSAVPR